MYQSTSTSGISIFTYVFSFVISKNALQSKNLIYKTNYSGWYCVSDETFLTESQLTENDRKEKVSLESGHPVQWTEEENYMFKLSNYHDDLIYWIKQRLDISSFCFSKFP